MVSHKNDDILTVGSRNRKEPAEGEAKAAVEDTRLVFSSVRLQAG